MASANIGIRPLTPHIGAEVDGVDLSQPLSDGQLSDIRRAFLDWSVLVFRNQRISRAQHKAFGAHFGPLHVHPLKAAHAYDGGDDPEVLLVKTTAKSKYTAGDGWHTDVSCDEKPPMGSMLYVTEVPPNGGGDTLFADMYRAFESLSEPMQRFLETLTAVHDGARPYLGSYGYQPPTGQTYPKHEHPVVTRHPETGRKVLFVNSGFTTHIKGLRPFESKALLDMLFDHIATTPSLTCRVRWEPGTLTFWDNRCTQHHAVWDYFPESRYGERVSIVGDRPRA
jgi:taurine dioxygenase